MTIQLRPDLAPNHVARIKELVREGFYDGVVFHRVIDGFMAQTGDPTGTGIGGSGKKLKAEFSKEPHVRGTVSMARAQNPDSGDSQFFICFADARFLDGQYTVWGEVIEGMEAIDKIKRGEPVKDPDKIVSVKVAADVRHRGRVPARLPAGACYNDAALVGGRTMSDPSSRMGRGRTGARCAGRSAISASRRHGWTGGRAARGSAA